MVTFSYAGLVISLRCVISVIKHMHTHRKKTTYDTGVVYDINLFLLAFSQSEVRLRADRRGCHGSSSHQLDIDSRASHLYPQSRGQSVSPSNDYYVKSVSS